MMQRNSRAKSAAVADPSASASTSSSCWTSHAALSTPTTDEDLQLGHEPRRLCSTTSVTSTSTYVQPSQLPTVEGIYENSDGDDLDDASDSVRRRFRKKQQQRDSVGSGGSAKNVRRWKVNELLSTPPRLIRKIKNVVDVTTTTDSHHGHRKLAASRSADELIGGRESKAAVERPPQRRVEHSRFSYIYGSVSDDDVAGGGGGNDTSSRLETLDRLIPVYEEFKSATARSMSTSSQRNSRNSEHYASIDDLDDKPATKTCDVEQRAMSAVYDMAAPLPELDNQPTAAAAVLHQPDVEEEDIELPPVDGRTENFPCPVCEEMSSASLEESDGGTCWFVAAMQELVVSQAVDARTCGNCTTAGDGGCRSARWRCLDCRHDLCGPCHDAHRSLRLRHRVVSIADLQTGRHQREISAALAMPCRRHGDRDAAALCLDCGTVVCGECRRDGQPHAGHRVTEQLADVAARQRDFIDTLLGDTSRRLNELGDNGQLIADYRKQFEAEREDVIRAINAQRDNVVRLIDEFCGNLIARVKQEYEFETDNVRDLVSALERTCSRVEHSSKFARQLVEHGRPVDVVTLTPVVRASLLAAARASPYPIDAKLVVNFRPRAVAVDDVEPIVGSVDDERVPYGETSANDGVTAAGDCSRRTGSRRQQRSNSTEGSGRSVNSSNSGPPTATTVEPPLPDSGSVVHEPVLLWSFPAGTSTDSKGCKPTAVAVASDDNQDSAGATLIAVVDDINKKVKVFDDSGQLQLEICPEGRRRLVDPWDVAVLRQPANKTSTTDQGDGLPTASTTGRYVVSDRGAKDIKVFSAAGEFVLSFGPHLSSPWGVCTNAARQVLVSDSGHRTVFVHDSAGILLFNVETFKHTVNGTRYHLQSSAFVDF